MYISMKTISIVLKVLFAGIIILNVSLSHNKDIPDNIQKKVGIVSAFLIIVIIALAVHFGFAGQ